MTSRLRDIALRLFAWTGLFDPDRLESWRRSEREAQREAASIRRRLNVLEQAHLPRRRGGA